MKCPTGVVADIHTDSMGINVESIEGNSQISLSTVSVDELVLIR